MKPSLRDGLALAFASTFPLLSTWVYFVACGGDYDSPAAGGTAGKGGKAGAAGKGGKAGAGGSLSLVAQPARFPFGPRRSSIWAVNSTVSEKTITVVPMTLISGVTPRRMEEKT